MFKLEHIHPMVVHFPIVLILTGFLFEVIYLFFRKNNFFQETGFWMLCIGALTVVAAYFSGAFLTKELYGTAGVIQSTHELFAEFTVFSALIGTTLKVYLKIEKKEETWLKWIDFGLYAITTILICITGYYGGILVYEYLMN
ncbi:MAG TPA: DUF2231 domain-containing protein [Draconibacterium sp.]|nr:DUF2231 domain-containing protein [Draconibacterium sp.]